MKTQLENIYTSAKADIDKALTISDIEEIRLKYLSRKGEFNSINDFSSIHNKRRGVKCHAFADRMINFCNVPAYLPA